MSASRLRTPGGRVEVVCPSCRGPLRDDCTEVVCASEGIAFPAVPLPELILPESRERVAGFLSRYLAVRHEERWTDDDRDFLLALPYADLSRRREWMWRVRARGLDALRRGLRAHFGARALRVCERGAGVAWLSYRLARDGHDVLATDVNADRRDGLGAALRYVEAGVPMAVVAAEAERLPLADGSVDAVVNAASFHYAVGRERQEASAREAARVLAQGGVLAILDSPVYSTRAAGEAMVAEWRDRRGGSPPASADSGYLVRDEILDVLREAGFEPSARAHWMGARWTANYVRHRLRGPREPATLPIILGVKS